MKNYIGISQQEKRKNIYRIISIDRLIEMFDKKINTLVKPEKWDDPFENFLYNTPIKHSNGSVSKSSFKNRAYGQCWTINQESDAMWRIYAPEKNGVKIRTTIRKLYVSLYGKNPIYSSMSCFIGRVEYYFKKDIEQLILDRISNINQPTGSIAQAKSLLFKRKAFKHEQEVRLIYLDPQNKSEDEIYQYTCDPFSLIDYITFDPRMNSRVFKIFKDHLKDIGYQRPIVQSTLYRSPVYLK